MSAKYYQKNKDLKFKKLWKKVETIYKNGWKNYKTWWHWIEEYEFHQYKVPIW